MKSSRLPRYMTKYSTRMGNFFGQIDRYLPTRIFSNFYNQKNNFFRVVRNSAQFRTYISKLDLSISSQNPVKSNSNSSTVTSSSDDTFLAK